MRLSAVADAAKKICCLEMNARWAGSICENCLAMDRSFPLRLSGKHKSENRSERHLAKPEDQQRNAWPRRHPCRRNRSNLQEEVWRCQQNSCTIRQDRPTSNISIVCGPTEAKGVLNVDGQAVQKSHFSNLAG